MNEIANGVLQLAIDDFAGVKGVPYDSRRFCSKLAKERLLYQDLNEIVKDISSAIYVKTTSILPRTDLEYNFCYKLIYTGNILVGLDPREFDDDQSDVAPYL